MKVWPSTLSPFTSTIQVSKTYDFNLRSQQKLRNTLIVTLTQLVTSLLRWWKCHYFGKGMISEKKRRFSLNIKPKVLIFHYFRKIVLCRTDFRDSLVILGTHFRELIQSYHFFADFFSWQYFQWLSLLLTGKKFSIKKST